MVSASSVTCSATFKSGAGVSDGLGADMGGEGTDVTDVGVGLDVGVGVDQLEFKASRNDTSKECRKDFDQVSPTPFLNWEDIC